MNCEWVAEHLDEYELGALDGAERERLEAHVAACEPCRQRLADARSADEAVRSALAWAEPGPAFAERVVRRACRPVRRRWLVAALAAAAVLCIVFLRWNGGPRRSRPAPMPAVLAAPAGRLLAGELLDAYGRPADRIEAGQPYVASAGATLSLDPRSLVLLAGGTEFASEPGRPQRRPALTLLSGALVGDVADSGRELAVELAPELGGAVVRTRGCQFYGAGVPPHRLAGGVLSADLAGRWPEEIRVHVFEGTLALELGGQRLTLAPGDSAIIAGGVSAGSTQMVEARTRQLQLAIGEDVLARRRRYAHLCDAYARRLVELRSASGRGALAYLPERRGLVEELLAAHSDALGRMEAEHAGLMELDAAEAELRRLDQLREEAFRALERLVLLDDAG